MSGWAALIAGALFGLGLEVSGMTEPTNVLAFLNLGPAWDPALMVVMGAALLTTTLGYRLLGGRERPLFADTFHLPNRSDIDPQLLLGALLFGIGWGMAGFCPGPALVALFTLDFRALWFVIGLLGGMIGHELWQRARDQQVGPDSVRTDG